MPNRAKEFAMCTCDDAAEKVAGVVAAAKCFELARSYANGSSATCVTCEVHYYTGSSGVRAREIHSIPLRDTVNVDLQIAPIWTPFHTWARKMLQKMDDVDRVFFLQFELGNKRARVLQHDTNRMLRVHLFDYLDRQLEHVRRCCAEAHDFNVPYLVQGWLF